MLSSNVRNLYFFFNSPFSLSTVESGFFYSSIETNLYFYKGFLFKDSTFYLGRPPNDVFLVSNRERPFNKWCRRILSEDRPHPVPHNLHGLSEFSLQNPVYSSLKTYPGSPRSILTCPGVFLVVFLVIVLVQLKIISRTGLYLCSKPFSSMFPPKCLNSDRVPSERKLKDSVPYFSLTYFTRLTSVKSSRPQMSRPENSFYR